MSTTSQTLLSTNVPDGDEEQIPSHGSPRPSARLRPRSHYAWIAFLLIAAYPMFRLGARTRMILKASSILDAINSQTPPLWLRTYTHLLGNKFETKDIQIPGRYGPIPVRIYTPLNNPHAPVIVFIHGMAPTGYRDPIMTSLAASMAKIGLQVITPDIRSERQLLVSFSAISDIDEVARWAAMKNKQQVSLMGVSFSGGLVIVAAAQPGYAHYVKTVLCVSGYNDIHRFSEYYIRHGEVGPDNRPDSAKPPPDGPLMLAIQHLGEMVPADDEAAIRKVTLDYLRKQPEKERQDLVQLTPAQRKLFIDLQTLDTPEIRQKYAALVERHKTELAAISPHSGMGGLKASLFLVHGQYDDTIPVSEAEWNVHDAPRTVPVHLFVSPIMHHVVLDEYTHPLQKLKLANYLATMLFAAGLD